MEAHIESAGLLYAVCHNALAPHRGLDANIELLQGSVPPNP